MEEKTGEEGRYGAMSSPSLQLSVMNLLITLSSKMMGGKRYIELGQWTENASINLAPGSGRKEE